MSKLAILDKLLDIALPFLDPQKRRIYSYRSAVRLAMEYRRRDKLINKARVHQSWKQETKNKKILHWELENEKIWAKLEKVLIKN